MYTYIYVYIYIKVYIIYIYVYIYLYIYLFIYIYINHTQTHTQTQTQTHRHFSNHPVRGGGLGSRPNKMYGERLGDGVEYHLMSPTPRRYVPFTTGHRAH